MKATSHYFTLYFFVFIFSGTFFGQVVSKEIKAKIEIESTENLFVITGTVENMTEVYKSLYYKLSVFKKDKKTENKSSNSQDGRFTLEGNQKKSLSKATINSTNEEETVVLLLIFDEEKVLLAKDRVVLEEGQVQYKNDKSTTDKTDDGLVMTGIISDETKTKLGKDFYDYFYTSYNKIKINSAKIIAIEEELTFARTTKIAVKIDNEIINEFISKPDDEFLVAMAEDSVNKVFEYLKRLEKQAKIINQY
jgi:hypothetical protein